MSQSSRPTKAIQSAPAATPAQDDVLARLVDLLAQRLTAADEPPPVATARTQFAYTMLAELLGRPVPPVPRVGVERGVADNGNTSTLKFVSLNGGTTARLRARDGTLKTFDGLTVGQTVDTEIHQAVPIDIVVVLVADGAATGIALCPPPPQPVE